MERKPIVDDTRGEDVSQDPNADVARERLSALQDEIMAMSIFAAAAYKAESLDYRRWASQFSS